MRQYHVEISVMYDNQMASYQEVEEGQFVRD